MEDTQTDEQIFINHIAKHYNALQCKFKEFCRLNNLEWDWDIFQDTILKCHELIKRKGLQSKTPYGIESYFFISFRNNVKREKQYARNQKRDMNYDSDSIEELYEEYYNNNNTSSTEKIKSDLWKDFSVLYIMLTVEQHFTQEDFYLFRLKTLSNMTYKQIIEKTKLKGVRTRILEIKKWLKENLTKEEIKDEFYKNYKELL